MKIEMKEYTDIPLDPIHWILLKMKIKNNDYTDGDYLSSPLMLKIKKKDNTDLIQKAITIVVH